MNSVEKQMVEYLAKNPLIQPYIVLQDQIIRGNHCMTKRRPDMLISSSNNLSIIVECDEKQHSGYDSSCEDSRMSEILAELFTGNSDRIVIIRWNPDYYKIGNVKGSCSRNERLQKLSDLIMMIINSDIQIANSVSVYYMFYTMTNEAITSKFETEFIY